MIMNKSRQPPSAVNEFMLRWYTKTARNMLQSGISPAHIKSLTVYGVTKLLNAKTITARHAAQKLDVYFQVVDDLTAEEAKKHGGN